MRIMSWNIERFGFNKLAPNWWDKTAARRGHIRKIIGEAQPDVLVVQEVQTSPAEGFGGLISDPSGGIGVRVLRLILRNLFPAAEWCVVPPAILTPQGGYSEGIAVFFKAQVLQFRGPMAWTAAGIRPNGPGVVPIPYGGLWGPVLPATPSGLGVNQNCLAGQFAFFKPPPNGHLIWNFPNENSRTPWLTRFFNPGTGRHLTLISVHFPPDPHDAATALTNLAQVTEVGVALAPNEDRVILGDFNINVNQPMQVGAFEHLTNGAPVCTIPYQEQFGPGSVTTVLPVFTAKSNPPPPYYEYVKDDEPGLDNAFVAREAPAAAVNNQAVVNTIVGVPLGAPPPPPPPPPPPATFQVDMFEDIPAINVRPKGAGRYARFNTLINYGHIGGRRGASDHLPIVFDLP